MKKMIEALSVFIKIDSNQIVQSASSFKPLKYLFITIPTLFGLFMSGIIGGIIMMFSGFIVLKVFNSNNISK